MVGKINQDDHAIFPGMIMFCYIIHHVYASEEGNVKRFHENCHFSKKKLFYVTRPLTDAISHSWKQINSILFHFFLCIYFSLFFWVGLKKSTFILVILWGICKCIVKGGPNTFKIHWFWDVIVPFSKPKKRFGICIFLGF